MVAQSSERQMVGDDGLAVGIDASDEMLRMAARRHLRELRRVLRVGGRILVGFHAKETAVAASFPETVYSFYSRDEVSGLLRDAGFAPGSSLARAGMAELADAMDLNSPRRGRELDASANLKLGSVGWRWVLTGTCLGTATQLRRRLPSAGADTSGLRVRVA